MSVVESCITAAVIATTMAVALPKLNRTLETYALRAAAHEVAGQMQAARIGAITGNRDCRLVVVSPTSYVRECQDTVWQVAAIIRLPRGITMTANARPEFHWRGNASPTATFTLRSAHGTVARVVVNVNGRVRIQ